MAKARAGAGLVAACLTLMGGAAVARAQFDDFKVSPNYQPRPEDIDKILNFYRPTQEGVAYTKPTAQEAKACTLKLLVGSRKGSTGWLLLDAQGRPLRRFLDRNGDRAIDVWCYFKDGVEVYRETAISTSNNPDDMPKAANHFRWLNAGGTKWGVDLDQDGKIDFWKAISPEEAAQEMFQAVVTRNYARLKALFISEAEVRSLKLPAAEAKRIADLQKQAPARFQKMLDSLANLTAKSNFVRVESAPPECAPADGTDPDLIHYASRSILYENAGKHDWLQTGEMIQVGRAAWRLVDAPTAGDIPAPVEEAKSKVDPQLQKLFEQVSALDAKAPAPEAAKAEMTRYNQERVGLVQQILPKLMDAKDRETWTKQLADNLSTLAQADDKGALQRLVAMKDETVKSMPGTNLAGYLHYRVLWTEFAPKLVKVDSKEAAKVQEQWLGELAKYVQAYPKGDDTPDALIQLAVGSEFAGKDEEAKRWYQQIPANFPDNPMAPKAAGAIKRLELASKPMELAGTTTAGKAFDLKSLSGKVVVVYYWASTCEVCAGDFARIKQMLQTHGSKGLELVTVNLDDQPGEASKYLQATPVPGTHLVQPATGPAGGLVGPLATQYGINGLPSMFLVGKDGKVVSTKLQMNELEEAVRKAL